MSKESLKSVKKSAKAQSVNVKSQISVEEKREKYRGLSMSEFSTVVFLTGNYPSAEVDEDIKLWEEVNGQKFGYEYENTPTEYREKILLGLFEERLRLQKEKETLEKELN